jgi:nucleoside-diphosphate-sugar epimerase
MKTLVTGGSGRIGRVLRAHLSHLPLTFKSRLELDVTDPSALCAALSGHDAVIHLATPIKANSESIDVFTHSVSMVRGLLEVAREAGVRRVVVPSSISAVATEQLYGRLPITVDSARPAQGEYGRTRYLVEGLAREAATNGLDVLCVRLGFVRFPDAPPLRRPDGRAHWLSHQDCAALFEACVTASIDPGRFALFFGVSDLPERILDVTNPIGWRPRSTRVGFRRTLVATLSRINTAVRGTLQIRTRLKRWTTPRS